MDDEYSTSADPYEQLTVIKQIREVTSQKLKTLDKSLSKFIKKFDSQSQALQNLYEETSHQQVVAANIKDTQTILSDALELLTVPDQLKPIICEPMEDNYEQYIEAMDQIQQTIKKISIWKFDGVSTTVAQLRELQDEGRIELTNCFYGRMFQIFLQPLKDECFDFVNDKFEIVSYDLQVDICYPVDKTDFLKANMIVKALDSIGVLDEIISAYTDSRNDYLNQSLNPLIHKTQEHESCQQPLDILDITYYTKCSHPFHRFSYELMFLLKRERQFVLRIFGNERISIYHNIATSILKVYAQSVVSPLVRATISPLNSENILQALDIISTITDIIIEITSQPNLQGYSAGLSSVKKLIHDQLKSFFSQYAQQVLTHDSRSVPANGDVCVMTSNVLIYMIKLYDYKNALDAVPGNSLENVYTEIIKNMMTNLTEKSNSYSDPVITQLFRMNNAHFAITTIQSSKMASVVPAEIVTQLDESVTTAQQVYSKLTWDSAFDLLGPKPELADVTPAHPKPLTKKQRLVLKYQFRDFCKRIDVIRAAHVNYCLKNTKLMQAIMNETIRKVNVIYEKFWNKWKDSGFSQTPEKWISYQPTTLVQLVTSVYSPYKPRTSE